MFSINDGATWERVESRILNTSNEYLWKVPDLESDKCKIKISAKMKKYMIFQNKYLQYQSYQN